MTTRQQKIMEACEDLYNDMQRHKEWDKYYNEKHWNKTMVDVEKKPHQTFFCMDVCFHRGGYEIFRPHDRYDEEFDEDDDHPNLVGKEILIDMIKSCAKRVGLKLTSTFKPVVSPNEKGWVRVGFEQTKKSNVENIKIEDVWKVVNEVYNTSRKNKQSIMKYSDLRKEVMKILNINKIEFEYLFTKLHEENWQSINLHGTLVGEYQKHVNFRYRGRLYPFVSLTR